MKLKISNFGKIDNTELDIDGITVVAGYNDTGKSTIGKVLFSIFNSLNDIEGKIVVHKKQEIQRICNSILRNIYDSSSFKNEKEFISYINISRNIANEICELNSSNGEDLKKIIHKNINIDGKYTKERDILFEDNHLIEDMVNKISMILNTSQQLLSKEIISRYFNNVFSGQINCLYNENTEAKIELIIRNKKIELIFKNNQCIEYTTETNILHEAYYIDNPFVIDEIDSIKSYKDPIKAHITSKLDKPKTDIMENIFDAVNAKQKLNEIYQALETVINGDIVETRGAYRIENSKYYEPLNIKNLSTGLKSFIIIKMLLDKGIIKDKDVLVLDEPEIHLHPKWQLIYAEIIVLLKKYFDLSIVVTTHSMNFLEAIDYFSKKYKIEEKCNYYLAMSQEGIRSFDNVTKDLNKIYLQMTQPSVELDKLKYEMEEFDDE